MKTSIHAVFLATLVAAACVAVSPPPAFAQDIGPALDPGLMTGWAGGAAVQYDLEKRARRARKGYAASGARHRLQAGSTTASFRYTPTREAKQKALTAFLAPLSASNPDAARQIAAQFKLHDVDAVYRSLIAGTGLVDNDVADALTAYLLLNWMIANNATAEPAVARVRAARSQVAALLATKPQLGSTATRALLGEEYKFLLVTLHSGWQSARRGGTLKQYSDSVAQRFQSQNGQDLRALKITNAGFYK